MSETAAAVGLERLERLERRDLVPAACAALLVALALSAALHPERALFHRDLGMHVHPVLAEARGQGATELVPFWQHSSAEGRPLLANPGFSLLAPPSLLWALFPHEVAFDLFLVLHAMLGAAGASLLARSLGASRTASLLAGAGLGLAGGTYSALDLYWTLVAYGWSPWVLLAGVLACSAPSPRRLALLSLALGLQANGGMAEVVLATLFIGGLLGLAVAPGALPRRVLRTAWVWGAAGLVGMALAAPQLLPAALHARDTLRGYGFTTAGILFNSLDPRALPSLSLPGWGGSPFERLVPGAFPGSAWTDTGTPYLVSLYCGLGCSLLALAGAAFGRNRRVSLALSVAVAVGILMALGRHLPGASALVDLVAPLPLRYPVKALFVTLPCVPLLAAFGLDAMRERLRLARPLVLAIVLTAVVDLLSAHLGYAPTIAVADLREPPLAVFLKERAQGLGAPSAQWRIHHQRFPSREWGPPADSLEPSSRAMHVWERRMLFPPTGAPHDIRHAFERLPDHLEDLRHFEAARALYALDGPDWARRLGEAAVLFVVSPLPGLEADSEGLLVRERELGPLDGLPSASGFVYRNEAFRARLSFSPAGGPAAEGSGARIAREDARGLTLDLTTPVAARLRIADSLGRLDQWTASLSGGERLALEPEGDCRLSLAIPSGEWTLRLEHRPPGWHAGLSLCAAGLALVGLGLAWPTRSRQAA